VLVTSGPFAIVRHPIYTGLIALLLGAALVLDSLLTLGLSVLFVLPLWFHTAIEEPLMEQHFGEAWRDYAKRVPRLMPGWRGSRPSLTATPRSPR
jgi:protein-S-isoprenylcysteine O-methyltransferase Ste14